MKEQSNHSTPIESNIHHSPIIGEEFREVAKYYPIFFIKDSDTGQFTPVALFGLAINENLYQASGLWSRCYLPLFLQSQAELSEQHNSRSCTQFFTQLSQGCELNKMFVEALVKYNLIEAVELDVCFDDGKQQQFKGLYTINKDNLANVSTEIQKHFEQQGYVKLMADMMASLCHVKALIEMKNRLNTLTK
jgi:hypothetical protein